MDCPQDISGEHFNRRRCEPCADARNKAMKKSWNSTPEAIAWSKAYKSRPEYLASRRKHYRENLKDDPEYRRKSRERQRRLYANPDYRERQLAREADRWASAPESENVTVTTGDVDTRLILNIENGRGR